MLDQIAQARAELAGMGYDPDAQAPERRVRRELGRPLRAQVLDALDDLGHVAYSREVMLYLGATTGERIESTRFGTLRQQEIRAFNGPRARSVYIAYGLTNKGEAIKRVLGRSDWPLHERVFAPTTGRVQHLQMTRRLCEIGIERGSSVADPFALNLLIADHARDLPGVRYRRGEFPLEEWRALADELLQEVYERDRESRETIARRLMMLNASDQLFGTEKAVDPEPRLRTPITQDSLG